MLISSLIRIYKSLDFLKSEFASRLFNYLQGGENKKT